MEGKREVEERTENTGRVSQSAERNEVLKENYKLPAVPVKKLTPKPSAPKLRAPPTKLADVIWDV